MEAVLTSTHNLCLELKYEKYQIFYLIFFQFLLVKFSIYLNRLVFVMDTDACAVFIVSFRTDRPKQTVYPDQTPQNVAFAIMNSSLERNILWMIKYFVPKVQFQDPLYNGFL